MSCRCGDVDHVAAKCSSVHCFNCEALGNRAEDYTMPALCSICLEKGHDVNVCPFFLYSTNAVDAPLTYLNIYDTPHELSDEALTLRLGKYCSVFSTRRVKFSNSHVYNGLCHYRVRVKEPLPSYLGISLCDFLMMDNSILVAAAICWSLC